MLFSFTAHSSDLLQIVSIIHDPDEAQKVIRMQMRGDSQACFSLFKEAVTQENPVAQIHLTNAYYAMRYWAKDNEKKEFNSMGQKDLESYRFALRAFDLLTFMYNDVQLDLDVLERGKKAKATFSQAARQGNAFAQLVLALKSFWGSYRGFGAACKLRPLLDKHSFSELLYHYGSALFVSGLHNQQFELEGLSYMEKSGLLDIECANTTLEKDFYDYWINYVRHKNCSDTYYNRYGMLFIGSGSKILVPSQEHWQRFKQEKLESIQSSPVELFDIYQKYNMKMIYLFKKKYDIRLVAGSCSGNSHLWIYMMDKKLAEIRVDRIEKTIEIQRDYNNFFPLEEDLLSFKHMIAFIRDAMQRCADGSSVHQMIESLYYDFD